MTPSIPPRPAEASPEIRPPADFTGRQRYALYAVCFGFFLVLLDTTALNVAVAAMERDFGGTISGPQWVVNSYTIVFASLLLTCGALGDRFGARRLYQSGLVLFTGMSLLCALSPNVVFLVGMRILQGLGAAMMLPASLSLLSHAFPKPEERSRAVAFWASIVSLGFAAGPALGGVLTYYLGWRSIFWINVPVGLLAVGMVRRFVAESTVAVPRRIDWLGQTLVILALFSLTYALIEGGKSGWLAPHILTAFGVAIMFAVIFFRVEQNSEFPVLPASLFSKPTFSVCIAIGLTLNFCMYGTLFIESVELQNTRHFNALTTGLMILPFTVLPTLTTRWIDRHHGGKHIRTRLVIGHWVAAAGAATLVLSVASPGCLAILLGLGLLGVGMGFIMPAMTAGVLTSAPAEMSGLAAGLLNSARQTGGALGVGLMGSLEAIHHEQGLRWSFVIMICTFLLMAAVARRHMSHPELKHRTRQPT